MMESYFCICQKARISPVTTHIDQSLRFFATLIEFFPALIEKSPKILNPKLKDWCLDASWQIWSMNCNETFSRDEAHTIYLHLNNLTPVPDTYEIYL